MFQTHSGHIPLVYELVSCSLISSESDNLNLDGKEI